MTEQLICTIGYAIGFPIGVWLFFIIDKKIDEYKNRRR